MQQAGFIMPSEWCDCGPLCVEKHLIFHQNAIQSATCGVMSEYAWSVLCISGNAGEMDGLYTTVERKKGGCRRGCYGQNRA